MKTLSISKWWINDVVAERYAVDGSSAWAMQCIGIRQPMASAQIRVFKTLSTLFGNWPWFCAAKPAWCSTATTPSGSSRRQIVARANKSMRTIRRSGMPWARAECGYAIGDRKTSMNAREVTRLCA